MDRADRLEALITGNLDNASRRVHGSMAPRGHEATAELPLGDEETDAHLIVMGVAFSDAPASRKKFRRAILPSGWHVTPSDHYMYSHLRDDKNRRRAQIGYSAQDGWASIVVLRRFDAGHTSDDWNDREAPAIACIYDQGHDKKELWRGPAFSREKIEGTDEIARLRSQIAAFQSSPIEQATKAATAKLDQLAPDWRSVSAYWDAAGDTIVWPSHETPIDTRAEYVVMTECFSGGSYRDGGRHNSFKAKDDHEAREKLLPAMKSVTDFYDEVRWKLLCGSRVVDSGTERKAARVIFPRDLFTGMPMFDPHAGEPYGRDMRDD